LYNFLPININYQELNQPIWTNAHVLFEKKGKGYQISFHTQARNRELSFQAYGFGTFLPLCMIVEN
jgi:hypothetical protein